MLAMEQLAAQAARICFRFAELFGGTHGRTQSIWRGVRTPELHSDSLEALFLHSPGLKVVIPSSPYEAKGLLISAIRDENPVLFLEPMKLYRAFKEEVPDESYELPIGKAKIIREGDDLTLVTWDALVPLARKLAEKIANDQGIQIEVIDLRTIQPMDANTIIESFQKTSRLVIVHEAVKSGGGGGEIAALVSEKLSFYLASPIIRVTGYDTPYPIASVEDEWLPNEEQILERIHNVMAY